MYWMPSIKLFLRYCNVQLQLKAQTRRFSSTAVIFCLLKTVYCILNSCYPALFSCKKLQRLVTASYSLEKELKLSVCLCAWAVGNCLGRAHVATEHYYLCRVAYAGAYVVPCTSPGINEGIRNMSIVDRSARIHTMTLNNHVLTFSVSR